MPSRNHLKALGTPSRYKINSSEIYRARLLAGLTCEELGWMCGWSRQYQSRIECGDIPTMSSEQMEALIAALESCSIRAHVRIAGLRVSESD